MLCCDVAVAVQSARFAVTELRYGVPPTTIPLILHHKGLLGPIRPMLLTGEQFDAEAALGFHVVHRVAAPQKLDEAVEDYRGEFLRCAPGAFAVAKAIQRDILGKTFQQGLEYVGGQLNRAMKSAEAVEGRAAFLGKRKPGWAP